MRRPTLNWLSRILGKNLTHPFASFSVFDDKNFFSTKKVGWGVYRRGNLGQITHMFNIKPGQDGPYRPDTDKNDDDDIYWSLFFINEKAIYAHAKKIKSEQESDRKNNQKLDGQ